MSDSFLEPTLNQLESLLKNRQIRKKDPEFYKLLIRMIASIKTIIRLDAEVDKQRKIYLKLVYDFNKYVEGQTWLTLN